MREINEIILHCSASDIASYDFDAIKKDHVNNRKWQDIGYHYGIDYDGDIHILRPVSKPGAHVRGRNAHSIGVCILGNVNFTKTQLEQAGRLISSLCMLKDLDASCVRAHYEFTDQKTCPNIDIDFFRENFLNGI